MRKLVMEKAAIKHNLSVIKGKADGAVIYGVLSGDGGGAGIVPLARILRDEGIGRFAVSEVAEVAALRQAGFVDEEILMLRSTTRQEELEKLIDLMAIAPAKRFGLPLSEDDYTVFRLGKESTVDPESFLSMGKATPFAGWKSEADCLLTVCGGKAVYVADELK